LNKAVALGDVGKLLNIDVQGEMLNLTMTMNSVIAQLSTLANEVMRVTLEVGMEGIWGGQTFVPEALHGNKLIDCPYASDHMRSREK
jgi:osomolarity two-component system, sensor histidine kinase NIK1